MTGIARGGKGLGSELPDLPSLQEEIEEKAQREKERPPDEDPIAEARRKLPWFDAFARGLSSRLGIHVLVVSRLSSESGTLEIKAMHPDIGVIEIFGKPSELAYSARVLWREAERRLTESHKRVGADLIPPKDLPPLPSEIWGGEAAR